MIVAMQMMPKKTAYLALALFCFGCSDRDSEVPFDSGSTIDGASHFDAASDWKATFGDAGTKDGLIVSRADATSPDRGTDISPTADAPVADQRSTTGLSKPCSKAGYGWTVFRFHYSKSSKSARIDVWDASCSYSFAPNSACNVREVSRGFGNVSYTSLGEPVFTTSSYLRVRYSVAGLTFKQATLFVQARSYATASSTKFRAWSPLHGERIGGPVDNDWIYDWYTVDWSRLLSPHDKPSLTAIQIYASGGSGKLAVRAVELCVK